MGHYIVQIWGEKSNIIREFTIKIIDNEDYAIRKSSSNSLTIFDNYLEQQDDAIVELTLSKKHNNNNSNNNNNENNENSDNNNSSNNNGIVTKEDKSNNMIQIREEIIPDNYVMDKKDER